MTCEKKDKIARPEIHKQVSIAKRSLKGQGYKEVEISQYRKDFHQKVKVRSKGVTKKVSGLIASAV